MAAEDSAASPHSHFERALLKDSVLFKPRCLGSNFRDVIEHNLRAKQEGTCTRHGFVMPDTVQVHKVLPGRIEAVSLNGDVRFDVVYYASVCNPPIGAVLPCRVVTTNKFGVLAHFGVQKSDGEFLPVVESIVTKQGINGVTSEVDLDALKPGDNVNIEIVGKRFELNDDRISAIGRAVVSLKARRHALEKSHAQGMPEYRTATHEDGDADGASSKGPSSEVPSSDEDDGDDEEDKASVKNGVNSEEDESEGADDDGADDDGAEDDGAEDDGAEDDVRTIVVKPPRGDADDEDEADADEEDGEDGFDVNDDDADGEGEDLSDGDEDVDEKAVF
jgi:DNA-directed RNA polymerase subunit E'/Rpb7